MGVLFQYGAMLERQSQHAEAERVFRQVLARDPEHGPTLNYLGYTLVERGGRLDEAVALIKRAVALDPHNGAYLDSLGWAYFKLNQLDLAEPNLRTAAEQLPRRLRRPGPLGRLPREARPVRRCRRGVAPRARRRRRADRAPEDRAQDPRCLNKLGKR